MLFCKNFMRELNDLFEKIHHKEKYVQNIKFILDIMLYRFDQRILIILLNVSLDFIRSFKNIFSCT